MSEKKNSIINRILGYSVASWVNCIITFFSTPIITALFLPDELGKVNLFVAYANIVANAYIKQVTEEQNALEKESKEKYNKRVIEIRANTASRVAALS